MLHKHYTVLQFHMVPFLFGTKDINIYVFLLSIILLDNTFLLYSDILLLLLILLPYNDLQFVLFSLIQIQIHYEVVIQVDSYLYNPLFLIYTHSFFYLLLYPLSSVFSAFFRSLLLFFLSYLLYSLLSNPIFLSLHLYYLFLSSLVLDNFLFFYLYYIYYSYLYMFPLLPLFLLLSPHTV